MRVCLWVGRCVDVGVCGKGVGCVCVCVVCGDIDI